MRRLAPLLALLPIVAACDGSSPSDPTEDGGPMPTTDGGPFPPIDGAPPPGPCRVDAPYDDMPTATALVGERESDAFVSFDDDPQARYEWGFQGGTMILPVIGVPRSVAGDERCFDVTLRHMPDPDAPDAFGDVSAFPEMRVQVAGTVDGDAVWTEPIMDQIGFDDLDGTRLLLQVTVRGEHFAAQHEVAIEVVSGAPEACRALESTGGGGGGCAYRLVPGEAVVTSIEPWEPSTMGTPSCPDAREVRVRFEPADPATAVCYEGFFSGEPETALEIGPYALFPPASCLTDVSVGSRIPTTLGVIEGGGCLPTTWDFELPGCAEDCPM